MSDKWLYQCFGWMKWNDAWNIKACVCAIKIKWCYSCTVNESNENRYKLNCSCIKWKLVVSARGLFIWLEKSAGIPTVKCGS